MVDRRQSVMCNAIVESGESWEIHCKKVVIKRINRTGASISVR